MLPGVGGEVGVFSGGEDRVVTEDLLHFEQIDTSFYQMRGIAVAQAVRGDLFFKPHCVAT